MSAPSDHHTVAFRDAFVLQLAIPQLFYHSTLGVKGFLSLYVFTSDIFALERFMLVIGISEPARDTCLLVPSIITQSDAAGRHGFFEDLAGGSTTNSCGSDDRKTVMLCVYSTDGVW